jgi:hypothetical protein
MKQNNHYIWYLPLCFFSFFSCYILLKFIVIFFFMAAYTPSFLFDFSFFYAFTTFDHTQLLFIAMIVFLCELYFHITLSKRNLLYSIPLTLLLLGGIGLRVATSPISVSYLFHYLIFSLLIVVLLVDHRLYLLIPAGYKSPIGKTKMEIQKVSIPSFSSTHKIPSPSPQDHFTSTITSFSQSLQGFKQTLSSKLGFHPPQPISTVQTDQQISCNTEPFEDKPFVHPIEKQADMIPTTKQLLADLGNQSLDYLDSKIDSTKLEEYSFLDSFFSAPSFQDKRKTELGSSVFSSILDTINESAIIISRGVVKAANTNFASMVDQPIGDIVNKDFIEFLAPEGFSSFKSHCSKRLSGESSQTFRVVLLSKKHEKIPLQATIKSTKMNGEPVEITVFQKMNT